MESGPAQIDRYDRQRYVTIGADLGGMALGAATTAAHELPVAKSLPSSVKLIQTGDAELQAELSGAFIMAIVVGILCVFCVLVRSEESRAGKRGGSTGQTCWDP